MPKALLVQLHQLAEAQCERALRPDVMQEILINFASSFDSHSVRFLSLATCWP
jgi:hypothetical protein